MIEGATIAGIVDSLDDPYSKYLDKTDLGRFTDFRLEAKFCGIGVYVLQRRDWSL